MAGVTRQDAIRQAISNELEKHGALLDHPDLSDFQLTVNMGPGDLPREVAFRPTLRARARQDLRKSVANR